MQQFSNSFSQVPLFPPDNANQAVQEALTCCFDAGHIPQMVSVARSVNHFTNNFLTCTKYKENPITKG